jgi:hypothetical protein
MKTSYLLCLSAAGAAILSVRLLGNAYSDTAQYQIEYQGRDGATLWGEYNITERDRVRNPQTEKVIGKLPRTITFSARRNAIISVSGSSGDRSGLKIRITKNGAECGNSGGLAAGISDAIVCR